MTSKNEQKVTEKKSSDKEQRPSFKDSLLALGRKFDKKVQEEVQQFNEMGGFSHAGEYVAQNFNSALAKGASALGQEDVSAQILADREEMMAVGRKFDKKVQEEVQQFNEMGGFSHAGEYVAQNFNSALAKGTSALGQEDVSAQILAEREEMMALGRKFDKKVQEEVQQFNEMGGFSHAGEYVAQNFNSALAKGASALGQEDVSAKILAEREEMMAVGRKFDKKVQEEVQQFNKMGGFSHAGEYVAQNFGSALAKGYSALGQEDVFAQIFPNREEMMAVGRKFDKKVQEEVQQFNKMGGFSHAGEYVAQNFNSALAKGASALGQEDVFAQIFPNREEMMALGGGPFVENLHDLELNKVPVYLKAELCTQNTTDNLIVESSMIEGKKHGIEITRDSQNQILDVKLYNHGRPVDLDKNRVDVIQDVDEKGVMHNYCLLNNHMFGTETFVHSDGRTIANFYEEGGNIMYQTASSQVSFVQTNETQQDSKTLLANLTINKNKKER